MSDAAVLSSVAIAPRPTVIGIARILGSTPADTLDIMRAYCALGLVERTGGTLGGFRLTLLGEVALFEEINS